MTKIIFLCNWGETPKQLLTRYSNQTPNKSGVWGDIVGVDNFDDADVYIVLEGYGSPLPQDKTIFVKREPEFINKNKQPYKHTISWEDTNCGITWWLNKSYDDLKNLPYPDKTKKVSCVVSGKHQHRVNYVKLLFNGDSPIDLYGRHHDKNYYGENYKGELNYDGKCKLRGLIDYEYSIVLENSQEKNYWTEKLADAYLSWCIPLYWGCPNINEYFPEGSYHLLDMNSNNPIGDVNNIINKPVDIESLTKARNIVLDSYNIWEVINNKIKEL